MKLVFRFGGESRLPEHFDNYRDMVISAIQLNSLAAKQSIVGSGTLRAVFTGIQQRDN